MSRGAAPTETFPLSTATMLSDLSANIFAALLIVLILLLQIRVAADRAPAPQTPGDLPVRTHIPLSAGEVLTMLRERGSGFPGSAFDLVDAGVRTIDGTTLDGSALDGAIESAPAPVRFYVFSNRWFARATATLATMGRSWRDLSVPRALRARGDGEAWSPDFLDLLSERRDEPSFRTGLARLLSATAAPLVRDGHVAAAPERAAVGRSSAPMSASGGLAAVLLSAVIACFALGSGATLVLWTERRALGRIAEFDGVVGEEQSHV